MTFFLPWMGLIDSKMKSCIILSTARQKFHQKFIDARLQ